MSKDEALKLALEALEGLNNTNSHWWQEVDEQTLKKIEPAITAIKEALAQPEQCQCPDCRVTLHASDCAVHNEPAYPKGACNCGAQPEQEPVAWVDPTTLHHLKIGLEGVHLVYETEMVNSLPLYDKPQFQNPKKCLERLIRITGTFDLTTGHADTFDELLDSLESELCDVLGYYRQQRLLMLNAYYGRKTP